MIYLTLWSAWNIIVLLMYGVDKLLAVLNRRRISEATLLWSAVLFGGIGAFFGMLIFNHKTRKPRFRIVCLLSAIAWGAVLYMLRRSGVL